MVFLATFSKNYQLLLFFPSSSSAFRCFVWVWYTVHSALQADDINFHFSAIINVLFGGQKSPCFHLRSSFANFGTDRMHANVYRIVAIWLAIMKIASCDTFCRITCTRMCFCVLYIICALSVAWWFFKYVVFHFSVFHCCYCCCCCNTLLAGCIILEWADLPFFSLEKKHYPFLIQIEKSKSLNKFNEWKIKWMCLCL